MWRGQGPAFLVGFGHGAIHWIICTFYVLLPYIAETLDLSYTQTGGLVTVFHASADSVLLLASLAALFCITNSLAPGSYLFPVAALFEKQWLLSRPADVRRRRDIVPRYFRHLGLCVVFGQAGDPQLGDGPNA